jgi:hypothetical protein
LPTGHYMIVSNKLEGATSDLVAISELKSPYFLSTEHPVECFSFYFIFGIDEAADDLTVLIRKKDNRSSSRHFFTSLPNKKSTIFFLPNFMQYLF